MLFFIFCQNYPYTHGKSKHHKYDKERCSPFTYVRNLMSMYSLSTLDKKTLSQMLKK